ncbi:MAG: hypothetical protein IJ867_02085 [Clostridia bacterium]|nr:hypothetical protein [Clostridia bacterium]
MNSKNWQFWKIGLILFCFVFVFSVVSSSIIASDVIHIHQCCEEHCVTCQMIHSAVEFSKNLNYIMKYIVLIWATMPLVCLIRTKVISSFGETLVSLNVVLNE